MKKKDLNYLIDYLHKEYVDRLFTCDEPKYVSMCRDVIKHDCEEVIGYILNDKEVEEIRLKIRQLYEKM